VATVLESLLYFAGDLHLDDVFGQGVEIGEEIVLVVLLYIFG
jgi:hypothetical protein